MTSSRLRSPAAMFTNVDARHGRRAFAARMVALLAPLLCACFIGVPQASGVANLSVDVVNDADEQQLVTTWAGSGQFRLTFDGAETPDISYNASAATVEAMLNNLPSMSGVGGSVEVASITAGLPGDRERRYFVTFNGGSFAHQDVPELTWTHGTTPLAGVGPSKVEIVTHEPAGVRRNDQRVDYHVRVSNNAPAKPSPDVGDTVGCSPGTWGPGTAPPTFTYQWLRNGVVIPGATGSSYTVAPTDASTVLQCLVTGTNASAAHAIASRAVVVGPAPATTPPNNNLRPTVTGAGTTPGVSTRTCNPVPANWTPPPADPNAPTFTFQWTRNGVPISPAESPDVTTNVHTILAADVGKQLQCRVTGTNAGGAMIVASSANNIGPIPGAPTSSHPGGTPSISDATATQGEVTVVVDLPAGLSTSAHSFFIPPQAEMPITGWSCSAVAAFGAVSAKAVCRRSDALGPQASYPPIGIGVKLGQDAPETLTATARAADGAGASATSQPDELTMIAAAPFGITPGGLRTVVEDQAGNEYTQAGGHPWSVGAAVSLNGYRQPGGATQSTAGAQVSYERFLGAGQVRVVRTDTPAGFVGNPLAAGVLCEDAQLLLTPSGCPAESIVGAARVSYSGAGQGNLAGGVYPGIYGLDASEFALAAVEPERGEIAQFAFAEQITKGIFVFNARLRPDGNYAVSVDSAPVTTNLSFLRLGAYLCGYGALSSIGTGGNAFDGCKSPGDPGAFTKPFFTNPTVCSSTPPQTSMSLDSWNNPGVFFTETVDEPLLTGCDQVPFTPSMTTALTASAPDAPSGFEASISVPSDGLEDPNGISQSHLKKTVVELPEGVAVNPSGATGLAGCSDAQLGLRTDSEPACPDGSKIGTVTATTPVLEEALAGDLVLRTPKSTDPMSGDMLRLALIVENEERGVLVKLPGSATADPKTGRLTATFDDNPQLPIGNVTVKLKGGDRGMLALPQNCGDAVTKSTLTPWSGSADVPFEDTTSVAGDCGAGFAPKLTAGMSNSTARGTGTFAFSMTRQDGERWVNRLTAQLPVGLLASVKDVPLCSSAQASAGSCPQSSRIGTVDASAGSGDPFVLEQKGSAFLTEGYKGCAYGLLVSVPVIAGPFDAKTPESDLGDINVRQAVCVDPVTAQVTVASDEFPTIWHGIPLRVRSVTVLVDRDKFMLNPSSCAQKKVEATFHSPQGANAVAAAPFAATGCTGLAFKPKLAMRLTGRKQTRTGKHPGIKAVVTQQGTSEAGIEKAVVRLPKSLALDPDNAQALCEFTDGTKPDLENRCPKGSIVGRARAKTPLLKDDLVGNVFFVKNVRKDPATGNEIRTLPMLIVALRGVIAINLKGESSTTKAGKLVNTFASVPDAPITQFNLNINGGKTGIIAVTRTRKAKINLCAGRHIAETDMDGHNGRRHDTDVRMKTPCTKKQTKAAKRQAQRAAAKAKR
ncbi:MAG TPA: hypothetical protein VEW67_08405 [Thermoleophilaceae bacterium]|nr:hypothetical protein [Thermoleophilaceae bacterium]